MPKPTVSIIISNMENHPSLPRLLQSIAQQSNGLNSVEVIIVGTDNHSPSPLSVWSAILNSENIRLIALPPDTSVSQARNKAVANATGEYLLFLRPDYRLDPKYLLTVLSVFEDKPDMDIIYTDYIRLAPKKGTTRPGMVALPNFDDAIIQNQNIIGPGVIMHQDAWDATAGFRDNTLYSEWDLWIQAALSGCEFFHINYPLASCEYGKVSFRDRAEDGRYKAIIVINNQNFFHMHTVRWALAYLRGDAWAEGYKFMTIPSAMEVTRMMHDHNLKQMGGDQLINESIRQFDAHPTTTEAIR